MRLEQTIIIDRPIEEVFAYRTALDQTAEWQRDVIATELMTVGPTALGTHGIERRRGQHDVESDWALEITEFKLNSVLGIVSRCGEVQVRERDVFAQDEGNTRYTASVEMTGSRLPSAAFHRKTIEALMTMKWRLEGRKGAALK